MFGDASLAGLTDADLAELATSVPTVEIPRAELDAGINIVELLTRTTIADSKGAARRLIAQHGAYLNNHPVAEADRQITARDLLTETMMVLRGGKKTHRLVRAI